MPNSGPTAMELITLIGTIATPILLLVLSGIGWFIKRRLEASQKADEELRRRSEKLEEAIRGDRLQVYNDILEPFIMLFTKEESSSGNRPHKGKSNKQRALEIILSLKYRQAAFKLSLFANDDVVRAYNRLMQFSYKMEGTSESSEGHDSNATSLRILGIFGSFLLEIRKSVGNKATSLSNFEMLEWMINDIDTVKVQFEELQHR